MNIEKYGLVLTKDAKSDILQISNTQFGAFSDMNHYIINNCLKEKIDYSLSIYRTEFFSKTTLNTSESIRAEVQTDLGYLNIKIFHVNQIAKHQICYLLFEKSVDHISVEYNKVSIGPMFKELVYLIKEISNHIRFMVGTNNGTEVGW